MPDTPDRPDGTAAEPSFLHEPGRPEAEATEPAKPEPAKPEPAKHGQARPEGKSGSGVWVRGLHMLLVAMLIGLAQTVLQVVTLVQFVLMLIDTGRPNAQIAAFGKGLGDWFAKAARFQTGDSDEKPWPWTPLA